MKLKVAELFAGIGAWSKALEKIGIDHEIVEAVEFDHKTISSYNLIHDTNFESKDITKIDPEKFPDHDILFYSPPCQAFSVAGKQEGFSDEKGRGTLFFDALKIIQAKKPKFAIMENVKGLTQKKFQFEFETMLQLLEQEGYKNYWKVLNAKDYGIPQNRERVFIVSIRKDIEKTFNFPVEFDNGVRLKHLLEETVDEKYYISQDKTEKLLQEYIKGLQKKDRLPSELSLNGESISYCIDASYAKGISPGSVNDGRRTHIVETRPCITPDRINKRQNGRRFKEDGEPAFTLSTQDRHGILQIGMIEMKGNDQIRRVYDPNGVSPTLSTMQGGNRQPKVVVSYSRKTGIGKELDAAYTLNSSDWRGINRNQNQNAVLEYQPYLRIRKLTPLECFRLMGFEDSDYLILKENKVSNSQIYKMAGNSVVVNVIEELLKELIPEYIDKNKNTYQMI